jgi:plasmid stabilization system protein ParE
MAVKLTDNASETLSDIILHELQNEGLQKAETLEMAFYEAFERIDISPMAQNKLSTKLSVEDVELTTLDEKFVIAYQTLSEAVVVLDICHISRYANILNP